MEFIVESDIIIRAVDKPFHQRYVLGTFATSQEAYEHIQKYIHETKELHTFFARSYLCSKEEYEKIIQHKQIVAVNIVLGQFEDMLYVKKNA